MMCANYCHLAGRPGVIPGVLLDAGVLLVHWRKSSEKAHMSSDRFLSKPTRKIHTTYSQTNERVHPYKFIYYIRSKFGEGN